MWPEFLATLLADRPKFGPFGPIYAFTTENLGEYIPKIVRSEDRVLCVTGSGDHALNAIFCGASQVTCFDLNRLARVWMQLKVTAIIYLDFVEFKRFFMRTLPSGKLNRSALAFGQYRFLRLHLEKDVRSFLDRLYNVFDNNGACLRNSPIFNNRNDNARNKIRFNSYLGSGAKYQSLRVQLSTARINYLTSCIKELAPKLNGSFDVILLSNIADYAKFLYPDNSLQNFSKELLLPLMSHLAPHGQLCSAYAYAPTKIFHSEVDHAQMRRAALGSIGRMHEYKFSGAIKQKDLVVVHKS